MDYKQIIKSRDLRLMLLKFFCFIPDELMLRIQYQIKTNNKLNIKYPTRYTEKIQWYKIYYRDQLMIHCVDKYDVREYVESCGLSKILNECYGVYENPKEINFNCLPDAFVVKDTLGGGGNSVIIVENKHLINHECLMKQMRSWVRSNRLGLPEGGREWPYYKGKKHRIIIEEYIASDKEAGGLIDYKFLCFYGKTALIYVLSDRSIGNNASCGFFDENFTKLPYTESDELPLTREIYKPSNFIDLKNVAERLASPFPCARIDLYNQDNQIRFGEITFYDSSGFMKFEPDIFDYELGKKFKLPDITRL